MPVTTRRAQAQTGGCETHVITGGGGFPGFSLGKNLSASGHKVRLLDIKEPVWTMQEGMTFFQCDITKYDDVRKAVKGADVVFHMASHGMSGREQVSE